jgi:hypothetical protein
MISKPDEPDEPDDLWLATGEDVAAYRPLMQGDLLLIEAEPVLVVTHACSMRKGPVLHETQMVAPIVSHEVPRGQWSTGHYDYMPVTGVAVPGIAVPAAHLRAVTTRATPTLAAATRIGVMSDMGVRYLQQRMAFHLTRVAIDLPTLAEQTAPILAEAELHEDWVRELGEDAEPAFHALLDEDDRKLRNWLRSPATRNQAMRTVRQVIRSRREV